MPLMGVPFLLLNVNGSAPVIALVIVLFVIGEMLWVPTSQAVVAALAPADIRGAYMGVFGEHVVGRLGADAVPRPAGAQRLRRRDDVDVRRGRRRDRRDPRRSPPRAATTRTPLP